jgi:hypothetical protein
VKADEQRELLMGFVRHLCGPYGPGRVEAFTEECIEDFEVFVDDFLVSLEKVVTPDYKNPDPRCHYPWDDSPVGFCWSYAHHVDGQPGFENMVAICEGKCCAPGKKNTEMCECWKPQAEPLPPRCGRYLGDNDATNPQLTCVREKGHPGFCDNTSAAPDKGQS